MELAVKQRTNLPKFRGRKLANKDAPEFELGCNLLHLYLLNISWDLTLQLFSKPVTGKWSNSWPAPIQSPGPRVAFCDPATEPSFYPRSYESYTYNTLWGLEGSPGSGLDR